MAPKSSLLFLLTGLVAVFGHGCGTPTGSRQPASSPDLQCGDSQPIAIQGQSTGFLDCSISGMRHREVSIECPSFLPRSPSDVRATLFPSADTVPGPEYRCQRDEDCTERPHGKCSASSPRGASVCLYGCRADSECADDELCFCENPIGRCVPARCRTDGDCQGDALCGWYFPSGGGCRDTAFACQTAEDECANRLCRPPGQSLPRGYCTLENDRRTCVESLGCGIP